MCWVSHTPSPTPECAAPDFVWFNKRAASARVTTARDLAFYRRENDNLTPRYNLPGKSAPTRVVPSDVIPSFTYGKKVRPSTPIDDVMSHRFAEQAEDDLKRFYTEWADMQDNASTMVRKIPLTTASRGHAQFVKKATQYEEAREEHFKIKKFKNIATKIDNRRHKSACGMLLDRLTAEGEESNSQAVCQEASDLGDPM
jgi:hypothetical protein